MIAAQQSTAKLLLTINEVAEKLQVSRPHVQNLIHGKVVNVPALPHIRLGRRILVRRESLEAWCRGESPKKPIIIQPAVDMELVKRALYECALSRQNPTTNIYFVETEGAPFVKIGIAVNVDRRMTELRTGSPFPLKLIKAVRGTQQTECDIHRSFANLRRNGEWFEFTATLKAFVETIL